MSQADIIRAWKDEEFFLSLSEDERRLVPRHPAGDIETASLDEGRSAALYTIEWWCTPRDLC